MNRYSMILQWSNEDELFLVTIPEFSDTILLRRGFANEDGCQGHRVVNFKDGFLSILFYNL